MRTIVLVFMILLSCNNKFPKQDQKFAFQNSYNSTSWHIQFKVSKNIQLDDNTLKDSAGRVANIDIENDLMPKDSLIEFEKFITRNADKFYAADGPQTSTGVDRLKKLDIIVNKEGTKIYKLYVVVKDLDWSDTIEKIKEHVEGPIYYIEVPKKYYHEMKLARAYSIFGDSMIVDDILDDFRIE